MSNLYGGGRSGYSSGVCLHTAGSDARQFRHLLCDPDVTEHYRVIAFDLPWHGKSNPPPGFRDREYKLTTDSYKTTVMAICQHSNWIALSSQGAR